MWHPGLRKDRIRQPATQIPRKHIKTLRDFSRQQTGDPTANDNPRIFVDRSKLKASNTNGWTTPEQVESHWKRPKGGTPYDPPSDDSLRLAYGFRFRRPARRGSRIA